MKIEPRRCKEERTVLSRNSARKTRYPTAKNITGHPPHHTETSPKPHHFPYRALSLLSPRRLGLPGQHLAAHRKRLLCPHFSLFQRLFAGRYWVSSAPLSVDAAPLSRSLSPDGSREKAPSAAPGAESGGRTGLCPWAGGGWDAPCTPPSPAPRCSVWNALLLGALSSKIQTEMEPMISTTLLKIITWNN